MTIIHVIYALTSSGGDLHEAATHVSLATLWLLNPSARATIACNQQTHQALQSSVSLLFHEAVAVTRVPFTSSDTESLKLILPLLYPGAMYGRTPALIIENGGNSAYP